MSIASQKDWELVRQQRLEFRQRIYARHSGLCFYCDCRTYLQGAQGNQPLPSDAATIDHIVPQSVTGVYVDDGNVVLACHACNQQRLSMDAETFLKLKHAEHNHPIRWFLMRNLLGIHYPGDRLPKAIKGKRKWYRKRAEKIGLLTAASVLATGFVSFNVPLPSMALAAGLVCIAAGVVNLRTYWFTRKPLFSVIGLKP